MSLYQLKLYSYSVADLSRMSISTQMGFILNQSQHWYTLRRFGLVSPDPSLDADPGNGHWFNLNSFLAAPERIGKLYLGMFLQQAEAEGTPCRLMPRRIC